MEVLLYKWVGRGGRKGKGTFCVLIVSHYFFGIGIERTDFHEVSLKLPMTTTGDMTYKIIASEVSH